MHRPQSVLSTDETIQLENDGDSFFGDRPLSNVTNLANNPQITELEYAE